MNKKKANALVKEAVKRNVEVVVNTGDFLSNNFANEFAKQIEEENMQGIFVEGNWDHNLHITSEKVKVLKYETIKIKKYYFFGMDEKIFYSWEDMLDLTKAIPSEKLIFLTHEPPKGYLDLIWNGTRIGNLDYKIYDEKKQPLAHCFGHVHEANGIAHLKNTILINGAVADIPKAYILDLKTKNIETINLKG